MTLEHGGSYEPALPIPPGPLAAFRDLCIDANDPQRVGAFWAAVLGRTAEDPGQGVEELVALGATVLREPGEQRWWVLADPEGHEFCAFPPEAVATNDEDAEVAV